MDLIFETLIVLFGFSLGPKLHVDQLSPAPDESHCDIIRVQIRLQLKEFLVDRDHAVQVTFRWVAKVDAVVLGMLILVVILVVHVI